VGPNESIKRGQIKLTNAPILDELEVLVSKHKSHPMPEPEAMKAAQVILNKYV
jgi:hypothetical protein